MTGFIAHLYNLLLHFTNHYMKLPSQETPSVLSCSFGTQVLDWLFRVRVSVSKFNWNLRYNHFARIEHKIPFPTTLLVCIQIRCVETVSSIVKCVFVAAGTYLPNRCLTLNYSDFQIYCRNIIKQRNSFILLHLRFGADSIYVTYNNIEERSLLGCGTV
jgi:hypothetical protein